MEDYLNCIEQRQEHKNLKTVVVQRWRNATAKIEKHFHIDDDKEIQQDGKQ
jgi:hypothetical protein